jgi:hypothetical protein
MQAIYDLIGSVLIGGIVLMMLLQFNASVMEGAASQTFSTIVQSNITTVGELVEHDFRKIGYRVGAFPDSAISYADSTQIVFRGDIDNNQTLERVSYLFDAKAASAHENPRARVLHRTVTGSGNQGIDLGITRFRLTYYDKNRTLITENPVSSPSRIASITVTMDVESVAPYDGAYQGGNWERTIIPKNLR